MARKQVEIHPPGKIDIHQRKKTFERALSKLEVDGSLISENRELILRFIRDCRLGKTVLGRAKKRIGVARCLKYIGILRHLSRWFAKSFDDVSQDDMENLVEKLEDDRLKMFNGKKYSEATKVDIKKTIKKFWKWKDGKNKVYPELVEWIESYDPVKEVPALTREEVDKMIEGTTSLRNKAILMVLFDSGARIEELLNVRLKNQHLMWKEGLGCYMIRLEFSKTKARTISLPLSTEQLKKWIEVHPAKSDPNAQLFPIRYDNLRMTIGRLGQRVLGKRATAHMLRHSSATYYANRLKNHYKLCYRYGWTMASDMVNRYLDREGILEAETAGIVKAEKAAIENDRNRELREELAMLKEFQGTLSRENKKLQEKLDQLLSGKGVLTLVTELLRNQRCGANAIMKDSGKPFDLNLGGA